MNIAGLKDLKLGNLREHSPKTYRDLQQSGRLDEYLDNQSRAAYQELRSLDNAGYTDQEAWEVVRAEFLMPLDDPDDEEGPNAEILKALNETIDLQNRAWEELAEAPPHQDHDDWDEDLQR